MGRRRFNPARFASSSSSHTLAEPSDGARQSPRGDSDPPVTTFGPFGRAERLNWAVWKKRIRNFRNQPLIVARSYSTFSSVRRIRRPFSRARVAPGLVRQEGDLGRRHAEPAEVEQEEVVQRIGADRPLGRLDHPVLGGDQFGRDLGVQNGVQRLARLAADQIARRHPADQMADQRLGHASR